MSTFSYNQLQAKTPVEETRETFKYCWQ